MNKNNLGNIKAVVLIIIGVILAVGLGVGIGYFIEKNNKDLNLQTKESTPLTNEATSSETKNYYDCGSALDCFSNYMKDCKLAKFSDPGQSMEKSIIEGFEGDDCIVYLQPNASPEIKCKIPRNELETYESYLEEAFAGINNACSISVDNKMIDNTIETSDVQTKELVSQTKEVIINEKKYYDCGTGYKGNKECLSSYAKECKLAIISNYTQPVVGLRIEGFENSVCNISLFVAGLSEEIVCKIPKKELETFGNYLYLAFNGQNDACSSSPVKPFINFMLQIAEFVNGLKQYIPDKDTQIISDLEMLRAAIIVYEKDIDLSFCEKGIIYSSDKGTPAIDGTGWLPIDFTKVSGGPGFYSLPTHLDYLNLNPYQFSCDSSTKDFELNAKLMSESRSRGGAMDVVSTDGGDNPDVYEVGTNLNLIH